MLVGGGHPSGAVSQGVVEIRVARVPLGAVGVGVQQASVGVERPGERPLVVGARRRLPLGGAVHIHPRVLLLPLSPSVLEPYFNLQTGGLRLAHGV